MKSKPMRVPREFNCWIDNLSVEFSKQTGMPKNNSATMRRMAEKLNDKLIVKGLDFDWVLWKKRRR